jgi:ribosome assembly protein SQT1
VHPSGGFSGAAWSPKGDRIAVLEGGLQPRAVIWDARSQLKESAVRLDAPAAGALTALDWHPSGTFLAAGGANNVLVVWSLGSAPAIVYTRPCSDKVNCLAFNGDGSRLAVGCDDGSLYMFDVSQDVKPASPKPSTKEETPEPEMDEDSDTK